MNIQLPIKKGTESVTQNLEFNQLVIVGANGSGKTRFGSNIEERYNKITHRISAQKSLSMPEYVGTKSKEVAYSEFRFGAWNSNDQKWQEDHGWKHSRWGNNLNTFLLNDYEKLMTLLHTEEYEASLNYKELGGNKPNTKLDRIQRIFEIVLPHRKLTKGAGIIEVHPSGNSESNYNSSEMSDGERVIFYLVGEVVCAPENSIIIIDEPEMHIHRSLVKNLFDLIEQERTDCSFIYLTHDIDFAHTRQNAEKIWTKSYEGNNVWDYEILNESSPIPEQLYLEILGSRKPILFIEGDDSNSIDEKLLELVFSEYTVKPLGSCQKVFSTTKSFNEQNEFHNISSIGLIDRDRRTDDEIDHIRNSNIWVADVAEIENYLLLEKVVKTVANCMLKDEEVVFSQVKSNVINFFKSQIEKQALEHTIHRIERIFNNVTDNSSVKNINELEASLSSFWSQQNFRDIYDEIVRNFNDLYNHNNYDEILKVFNNKGMLANSNVVNLCDLNTKNNAYLNYVIGILKQKNEKSERIKTAIIEKINKRHTTTAIPNRLAAGATQAN